MRFTLFFALALSVTFFVGCGGGGGNPLGTVHVEGTVTLDGNPIEGVSVILIPRNGESSAGGITNASGRFTVNTGGFSGAKPGTYDVIFSKTEFPGQDLSFEESMERFGGRTPDPIHHIPQRYGSARISPIEPITVTTDRRQNVFTFELTSQ